MVSSDPASSIYGEMNLCWHYLHPLHISTTQFLLLQRSPLYDNNCCVVHTLEQIAGGAWRISIEKLWPRSMVHVPYETTSHGAAVNIFGIIIIFISGYVVDPLWYLNGTILWLVCLCCCQQSYSSVIPLKKGLRHTSITIEGDMYEWILHRIIYFVTSFICIVYYVLLLQYSVFFFIFCINILPPLRDACIKIKRHFATSICHMSDSICTCADLIP